jgi:antitoxin (DNA-binding transcriptional repressor) of toxin-antitoxin stability system
MAKLVQVRELKNQTTQLLRNVERGVTLVVTRRGKPVATLKKFQTSDLEPKPQHDTALWDHLSSRIAKRHPHIRTETADKAQREFERLTKKAALKLPFKTWQDADRWAKGRGPKR